MCSCSCLCLFMRVCVSSLNNFDFVKTAQEFMTRIVAEKTKFLASKKFNSQLKKNPNLLIQLFSK